MTPKNILIIKLSSIGDVVHALPVSYELKQKWPDCRITWVVEPASRGIVEMDACVDDIIDFEKQAFRSFGGFLQHFGPLKKAIQRRRYDLVLDLQGLFKSAAIAWLAKAPKGRKLGPVDMREGSDQVSRPVRGPLEAALGVEGLRGGAPAPRLRPPFSTPPRPSAPTPASATSPSPSAPRPSCSWAPPSPNAPAPTARPATCSSPATAACAASSGPARKVSIASPTSQPSRRGGKPRRY